MKSGNQEENYFSNFWGGELKANLSDSAIKAELEELIEEGEYRDRKLAVN